MVIHSSRSVFMVPGWFLWFFKVPGCFFMVQVGSFGYSRFQGGFSRFQVGFMVFKVPGSFFMVLSGFSWFFKASGWLFEVPSGF